jgi:predicted metalloprotease
VEDRRDQQVSVGRSAVGILAVRTVGRLFGVKGLMYLSIAGLGLWALGIIDPVAMLTGQPTVQEVEYQPTAEEQELYEFVTVVLGFTEDTWNAEFARRGGQYVEPALVVYKNLTETGCGVGDARMGPFYCPLDRTIYIDLGFYDELEQTFQAPGDFAQAYVLAHEIGHHVQNLLGISDEVAARRGRPDYNEWSVRLELQADFLAGVWAHHNRQYLERGDIMEAMRAANAIGDDAIQLRSQGRVVPHAFTHGTSEQRMEWFERGLKSGRLEDGDTFSVPYRSL